MSFININNLNVHYKKSGSGDAFILLHGISDSSNFWKPLTTNFLRNFETTAPDLRGHGESSREVQLSIELLTEDLNLLIEKLDIKMAHILGFSMGSLIAQNLCLEFSEKVKSLIICSGYCRSTEVISKKFKCLEKLTSKGGVSAFFDEMIQLVYTPEHLLKHPEYYKFKEQAVEMNSKEIIIQSLRSCRNFDVKNKISEIDVPTLILCGSEDGLISSKNSQILNHNISDSRLCMFPNTGHNIFLPSNLSKIVFEIENFI